MAIQHIAEQRKMRGYAIESQLKRGALYTRLQARSHHTAAGNTKQACLWAKMLQTALQAETFPYRRAALNITHRQMVDFVAFYLRSVKKCFHINHTLASAPAQSPAFDGHKKNANPEGLAFFELL